MPVTNVPTNQNGSVAADAAATQTSNPYIATSAETALIDQMNSTTATPAIAESDITNAMQKVVSGGINSNVQAGIIDVDSKFYSGQSVASTIANTIKLSDKISEGSPLGELTFRAPVKAYFMVTGDNPMQFQNFILESYSLADSEVIAATETFSSNIITAFGSNQTIYRLTGTVFDIKSHDWMRDFFNVYLNKLRATKLLLNKNTAFLHVDHIQIEGYPLDISFVKASTAPNSARFSMSFLEVGRTSNRSGSGSKDYYNTYGPDKLGGVNFEFRDPTKAFIYVPKGKYTSEEVYDKLIIEAYQMNESERYNVLKTFTSNFFSFYGARGATYNISGTTLDTSSHEWMEGLHHLFRTKISVKVLAANGIRMYIFVDDVVMEGYPISFSFNKSSADPMLSKFQMQFLKSSVRFKSAAKDKEQSNNKVFY